jgi:hypothetical protein
MRLVRGEGFLERGFEGRRKRVYEALLEGGLETVSKGAFGSLLED